jgi:hypothetical protein
MPSFSLVYNSRVDRNVQYSGAGWDYVYAERTFIVVPDGESFQWNNGRGKAFQMYSDPRMVEDPAAPKIGAQFPVWSHNDGGAIPAAPTAGNPGIGIEYWLEFTDQPTYNSGTNIWTLNCQQRRLAVAQFKVAYLSGGIIEEAPIRNCIPNLTSSGMSPVYGVSGLPSGSEGLFDATPAFLYGGTTGTNGAVFEDQSASLSVGYHWPDISASVKTDGLRFMTTTMSGTTGVFEGQGRNISGPDNGRLFYLSKSLSGPTGGTYGMTYVVNLRNGEITVDGKEIAGIPASWAGGVGRLARIARFAAVGIIQVNTPNYANPGTIDTDISWIKLTRDISTGAPTQTTVSIGTQSFPVIYTRTNGISWTQFYIGLNGEVDIPTGALDVSYTLNGFYPNTAPFNTGGHADAVVTSYPEPCCSLLPMATADGSTWMPGVGLPFTGLA